MGAGVCATGESDMKAHILVSALGLLLAASAPSLGQSGDAATPTPIKPGSVRVTTKAPEPDKWDAQNLNNNTRRLFKCKPLACPDPQTVIFTFSKSPTRHPDPKALERFAKEELPKSIRAASAAREVMSDGAEKAETLASDTATLKDFPSVINETKLSRGKTEVYVDTAIIFAGVLMVRVQSSSPNRDLAKKTMVEFIDVMRIEEGPPAPPPGTPPQRGT
jgi:hypothetical protein